MSLFKQNTCLTLKRLHILLLGSLLILAMAPYSQMVKPMQTNTTAIDEYIHAQMRAWNIPGAALVIVKDGGIVYQQGYGRAGRQGSPVTPQTPFEMGSCSKSFTALAVMQLVEQGSIELDAPVQRYLPWFQLADAQASAAITVRNLLNHASGIPQSTSQELMVNPQHLSLEDRVRSLKNLVPSQSPGVVYQYSNYNYMTLALIIEAVTGQTYAGRLQKTIFTPLEMDHSFVDFAAARQHGLADGHTWWWGWPLKSLEQSRPDMLGAGYLMVSAEDLGHYLIAQLDGGRYGSASVLSSQGIDAMHQPGQLAEGQSSYGMGWVQYEQDGLKHINHNGQSASFNCSMTLVPERRLGIAVLVNVSDLLSPQPTWSMILGVERLLNGQLAVADPAFRNFKLLWDGGMLLLSGVIAWSIFGDTRRWLKKLHASPPHTPEEITRRVTLPVAADGLIGLLALLGLPLGVGFETWRGMFVWQPDAVYWCLGAGIAMLVKASLRMRMAAKILKKFP